MCHLLYKECDSGDVRHFLKVKSIKLCPSRLEQVDLPPIFHTERDIFFEENKVNATISDHLLARGPTHSRKTHDHHLMQLGSVVLPRCGVFLATCSNIERFSCLVARTGASSESVILEARSLDRTRLFEYRWEDIVVSSRRTWVTMGKLSPKGRPTLWKEY